MVLKRNILPATHHRRRPLPHDQRRRVAERRWPATHEALRRPEDSTGEQRHQSRARRRPLSSCVDDQVIDTGVYRPTSEFIAPVVHKQHGRDLLVQPTGNENPSPIGLDVDDSVDRNAKNLAPFAARRSHLHATAAMPEKKPITSQTQNPHHRKRGPVTHNRARVCPSWGYIVRDACLDGRKPVGQGQCRDRQPEPPDGPRSLGRTTDPTCRAHLMSDRTLSV